MHLYVVAVPKDSVSKSGLLIPWDHNHIQAHTYTPPPTPPPNMMIGQSTEQVAGFLQCLLGTDGWPDACLDLTLVLTED